VKTAIINKIALHYDYREKETEKPVLVFVNSLGTDFRIWDEVVQHLEAEYSVLRYDKRGHGLSGLGSTPYSISDHVDDLVELLDYLNISEVILCGLSVGGLIAQGFFDKRQKQVRAMILCDTGHKIGTADMWQERINQIDEIGLPAMTDGVMERWFTPAFRTADNPEYQICRNMFERQDARGYAATCAAIRDADYTEVAKQIDVPTTCIVGDQDQATPVSLVSELSTLIEDAELCIIQDAGHIPCVEKPREFTEIIQAFLNKNLKQGV